MRNFKLRKGFTLMELLVAMSVFIVISTIASGVFINSLKGERRLVSLMSVQNNVSAALEQMAREMRGGYMFSEPSGLNCAKDSNGNYVGSDSITFMSPITNSTTSYSLSSAGAIMRSTSSMTSSNVKVADLCFIVSQEPVGTANMYDTGVTPNYCYPWRVTTLLTIVPATTTGLGIESIPIQTTVSSRVLPKDMPTAVKSSTQYADCN